MKIRRVKVKEPTLPPIPSHVLTVHGWVPVVFTEDPKYVEGGEFGAWDSHERTIYIRTGMHPTATWLTLYHEQCHADLSDIDFAITDDALEAICNAIAAARFAALRAGVPAP